VAERRTSVNSTMSTDTSDTLQTQSFDSVHITLNIETGSMLPLALR